MCAPSLCETPRGPKAGALVTLPVRTALPGCPPPGRLSACTAVNGEPSCVNRGLLTDTLRGEMGFDGFVVTDCTGAPPSLSMPPGLTGVWAFAAQARKGADQPALQVA